MKTLSFFIATVLSAVSLQAHCGSCSTDEMAHGDDASHKACYTGKLDDYFSIQKALASDDLPAAKLAAKTLQEGLASSACAEGDAACCTESVSAADGIASAKTISDARVGFLDFSKVMIDQVESHSPSQAVYKMYCPMAFNNKGGAWLQDNSSLRNPYYGASMLTCGMQQASYGKAESGHGDHDHSGHSH